MKLRIGLAPLKFCFCLHILTLGLQGTDLLSDYSRTYCLYYLNNFFTTAHGATLTHNPTISVFELIISSTWLGCTHSKFCMRHSWFYMLRISVTFCVCRYQRRQHLVDVTEIFNHLSREKKRRLFKIAALIVLLFLSLFW